MLLFMLLSYVMNIKIWEKYKTTTFEFNILYMLVQVLNWMSDTISET